ncbi:MAG: M28 family peptidase [bacterium]
MIWMPGKTYRGALPSLNSEQEKISQELRRDIEKLATEIGERNIWRLASLEAAATYIEQSLQQAGYEVERHGYEVENATYYNLAVEIRGTAHPDEIVIVGAHYDTVADCAGANDNGSGVAALLALARAFAGKQTDCTLRFVAFVNEEAPFFLEGTMGSMAYAERCRERNEKIVAMMSLETMGYYSDEKGSQKYPPPFNLFYPSEGNFVAFVANNASRKLVRQVVGSFRNHAKFPSEGVATFEGIQGIGWSDHRSFWMHGYPALMVTDTAPFRYPFYHTSLDTADRIRYDQLARVVKGLEAVVCDLACGTDRIIIGTSKSQ